MITILWKQHMEHFCYILPAFAETCDFFFFFLIFQNQSAVGDIIQLNKKKKPNLPPIS